jgi:hypothetical protein
MRKPAAVFARALALIAAAASIASAVIAGLVRNGDNYDYSLSSWHNGTTWAVLFSVAAVSVAAVLLSAVITMLTWGSDSGPSKPVTRLLAITAAASLLALGFVLWANLNPPEWNSPV